MVTGGAGFIGSHLVERLLAEGHRVMVIDNLASGRMENLPAVANHPSLSFHLQDASDYAAIKPIFQGADWVFHLAALADIVPSITDPLKYHRANVDATAAVLEAARGAGVKRFLYAASSSCYGMAEEFPTPESAPTRPIYPYALTKYIAEQYLLHWGQVYGLPCLSLRLFNVYGPRSRTTGAYGAVFGVFLAQKLAGKPFTVVGDGSQTRDFTYVADVADAFLCAARSELKQEVFNVGSGGSYSVNTLVELLGGDVVYLPQRPGEPHRTHADITKIRSRLGWNPRVGFEAGVQLMLKGIDQWRGAPVWDKDAIMAATREWFQYLGTPRENG